MRRLGTADRKRPACGQVLQAGQVLTDISVGDHQGAANLLQGRESVEIFDRLAAPGHTDHEVALDDVVPLRRERIHLLLRAERQIARSSDIRTLHRIAIAAVVPAVGRGDQKQPLLVPVGDRRGIGPDGGRLAQFHPRRSIRERAVVRRANRDPIVLDRRIVDVASAFEREGDDAVLTAERALVVPAVAARTRKRQTADDPKQFFHTLRVIVPD